LQGGAQNDWLRFKAPTVGSAPAQPTLAHGVGVGVVNVSWQGIAGATYNVKRSDSPNGPFLTVAYFRSGSSYADTAPLAGRTYYYRLSSNINGSESPDSVSQLIAK
jgi:cellulose 1,4-beta-cellobiosidase